ncbi:hypothetical protein ABT120_18230 [Nonomuraea angiospora]|uniref:hypothetical protein n=1 Tax=Nonomuraea angiospora TaxID=46172 RepID=UPI00331F527D
MPDARPPITLHHARLRAAPHGPDQPPPDPGVIVAQPDPEVIVARAALKAGADVATRLGPLID